MEFHPEHLMPASQLLVLALSRMHRRDELDASGPHFQVGGIFQQNQ